MIANIIFDIGRVLLEFKPKEYLLKKYKDEALVNILYPAIFESNEWVDLDRGSLTDEEAIAIFSKRHADYKLEVEDIMRDWPNILTPIEGSINLLGKLKNRGYKIILLSNFHLNAFQLVYNRYPFFKLADEMVISSKINMLKPSREIYEHMLNSLSLTPEECLFIDDTIANVQGAAKLGINAIQFENPIQLEKELVRLNLL